MKPAVEHRHMRHGRENPPRRLNTGQVHRIVQRRQRVQGLNFTQHFVVDDHPFAESFAAVNDAMADHGDLRRFPEHARFLRRQFDQHRLEGLFVPAPRKLARNLTPRSLLNQPHALHPNPFDQTARRLGFARGVEERVLER